MRGNRVWNRVLAFTVLGAAATTEAGVARADLNLPDPDTTPPRVEIVMPVDGQQLDATDAPFLIEVEASDDSGISEIRLMVDDFPTATDTESPWSFSRPLEPGTHSLLAVAKDYEGNEAESARIEVTVVEDATTTGDASEGDAGSGSSAPETGDSAGVASRGCSCSADRGAGATAWLPAWILLLRRRRR